MVATYADLRSVIGGDAFAILISRIDVGGDPWRIATLRVINKERRSFSRSIRARCAASAAPSLET